MATSEAKGNGDRAPDELHPSTTPGCASGQDGSVRDRREVEPKGSKPATLGRLMPLP